MGKLIKLYKESNRDKHFKYGIISGLFFTILFTIGCAAGLEFKDKQYGNKWDWIDFWFTVAGGFIGQILQLVLIWISYK